MQTRNAPCAASRANDDTEKMKMKELKIFYLENCPYCRKAKDALKDLITDHPDYGKVNTEWIEETRFPKIADGYAYYRVPSVFYGDEKLYECDPGDDYVKIRRQIAEALKTALAGQNEKGV